MSPAPESFPVNAVDCPDGLARCVGGTVEVSRAARIAQPCSGGPEGKACACPWDAVDTCSGGCASEGTQVVVMPDRAAARVCAPDPSSPVARPAAGVALPPGACDASEGFRCVQSLVLACPSSNVAPSAQAPAGGLVIAACTHGCVLEGETLGEEEATAEAATRILCAR